MRRSQARIGMAVVSLAVVGLVVACSDTDQLFLTNDCEFPIEYSNPSAVVPGWQTIAAGDTEQYAETIDMAPGVVDLVRLRIGPDAPEIDLFWTMGEPVRPGQWVTLVDAATCARLTTS